MIFVRQHVTLEESRRTDRLNSDNEKNKALLEYVAMMSDIEIPVDETAEEGGMAHEQNV